MPAASSSRFLVLRHEASLKLGLDGADLREALRFLVLRHEASLKPVRGGAT